MKEITRPEQNGTNPNGRIDRNTGFQKSREQHWKYYYQRLEVHLAAARERERGQTADVKSQNWHSNLHGDDSNRVHSGGTSSGILVRDDHRREDYLLGVWNLELDTMRYEAQVARAKGVTRKDSVSKIIRKSSIF